MPQTKQPCCCKQLKDLLDKNEYFKLDARYKQTSNELDESNRLYFKAFIDTAFNRNEEYVKDIDSSLPARILWQHRPGVFK